MSVEPRHRLLIVDDTETFRTALENQARSCARFATVATAVDGQQAWDRIQAALQGADGIVLPDVVIADFYMPNLNGVELMLALKTNPATARILGVIVSACESPAERDAAREAGAKAFFLKPGTPTGLRGLLEAASWLADSARAQAPATKPEIPAGQPGPREAGNFSAR